MFPPGLAHSFARTSLALLLTTAAVWAQDAVPGNAGPAILSRGDAPTAMTTSQTGFRPYMEVTGLYDSGLTGVAINGAGQLADTSAGGIMAVGGVDGVKAWRHTRIGLTYRGDLRHYSKQTYYDGANQSFLLGLSHQFTRHTLLTLRETAGMFSRPTGFGAALSQEVAFDPAASYVPTSDFFDNRTMYVTTQADFTIQRTARLSFNIGGDGTATKRRSAALAGMVGGAARGDVQYRLSRRSTIGATYTYTHFDFTRIFGGTDVHMATVGYSVRISRTFEFSAHAGAGKVESKFMQSQPVDPVIAALLGVYSVPQIVHNISTIPTAAARLSRTFHTGVFYIGAEHGVTPGNGLFLTSEKTNMRAAYLYTGLRRWTFQAISDYDFNKSLGNILGRYNNVTGGLSLSRQIRPGVHFLGGFDVRSYSSGDYSNYNRTVFTVRVGVGFSPGEVPFRGW